VNFFEKLRGSAMFDLFTMFDSSLYMRSLDDLAVGILTALLILFFSGICASWSDRERMPGR